MSAFQDSGGRAGISPMATVAASTGGTGSYSKIPVLTLSTANIVKLNPNDPNTIYTLWTAFTKCSDLIDNGKRLENMSWRLWNREVLHSREPENANGGQAVGKPQPATAKNKAKVRSKLKLSGMEQNQQTNHANHGDSNTHHHLPRGRSSTSLFANNKASSTSSSSFRPRIRRNSSSGSMANGKLKRKAFKDSISPLTTTTTTTSNVHNNKSITSEASVSPASVGNRSVSPLTPVTTASRPGPERERETRYSNISSHLKNTPSLSQQGIANGSNKSRRLSYAQIQHLLTLFKPESEDDAYWKHLWETKRQKKAQKDFVEAAQSVTSKSIIDLPAVAELSQNSRPAKPLNYQNLNPAIPQQKRRSLFSKTNTHEFSSNNINNTSGTGNPSSFQDRQTENASGSGAGGADSEDDGEGGRRPHRNATFTSIVRGFSPSHISVSFVNRSGMFEAAEKQNRAKNRAQDASDLTANELVSTDSLVKKASTSSQNQNLFKATKARPNKINRENMFFIESSPSDSETYIGEEGESLSSTEDNHHIMAAAVANRKDSRASISNVSTNSTAKPSSKTSNVSLFANNSSKVNLPPRHKSLFAKSKSSSLISTSKSHDKGQSPDSTSEKPATRIERTKDKDTNNTEKDNVHDDEDHGEDESAWDSVEEESDYSFDEKSLIPKDDDIQKKPLVRSSLLSSLFLNKPDVVQQEKEQADAKRLEDNNNKHVDDSQPNDSANPPTNIHYTAQSRMIDNGKEPTSSESPDQQSLPSNLMPFTNFKNIKDYNGRVANSESAVSVAGAMSPKTTRRNMLVSELSESLRKNLLFERQRTNTLNYHSPLSTTDKGSSGSGSASGSSTSDTKYKTLKRSHTSTGVPNIRPTIFGSMGGQDSWKDDMDDDNVDFNYHARGW